MPSKSLKEPAAIPDGAAWLDGVEQGRGRHHPEPDSPERVWQPTPEPVDWLHNTLTVTGPAERVEDFRAAAAGPGVIPWVLDLAGLEEEFLLPMAAPQDGVRAISLTGAKILARRLRDAVALNHQRALARIAHDRSCPFDLHRLLPVPAAILALGPEEGASRDWLRAHWGVTRPLRHAEALPATLDGRRKRMGQFRVAFWSADWSPWAALARLRRAWPDISLELQPHYPNAAQAGEDKGHGAMPEGTGRKDGARVGAGRRG
ncbi:hypothetical protein [Roseomonas xinghualingensis]|uniref:hypothetical protein n=1 Tax=Roseomonas xinghualingensis TaxID=2986475 RepID=UPI0021F15EDA|nr:hypothetical protein [Roseomonas sp. SXEYE001]MCV4210180.1 hypothetical protein [Roseomonas sp. SXEYE001]